jgi:N-acetylglutamate synthase-like GNAT family acetyltransferase
VRHARPEDLEQVSELLAHLRAVPGLVERKAGTFYRGSRAFLHFHQDPSGMYADVRLTEPDFERMRVNSSREQARLMTLVRQTLSDSST